MEKIDIDYYYSLQRKIDAYYGVSEEELIEIHNSLVNKVFQSNSEVENCGVAFVRHVLGEDYGRTIAYNYSDGVISFIKSRYLSDYAKSIIGNLCPEKLNDEVIGILNSDKALNDMSEEEIRVIYSYINQFASLDTKKSFMLFLHKLDGEGVISYIKNNIDNKDLACHILLTSGLNCRGGYYSGRGVNRSDLDSDHLISVFKKLHKLDMGYANNFVEMVNKMETLGATEFINTFIDFALNEFNIEGLEIESSNISFNGSYGDEVEAIAVASLLSSSDRNGTDGKRISEQIKKDFLKRVKMFLNNIRDPYEQLSSLGIDSSLFR